MKTIHNIAVPGILGNCSMRYPTSSVHGVEPSHGISPPLGKSNRGPGSAPGFTLIELMITVAIVAIIAAIAVPMYGEQMKKTRRADAYACLMDGSQHQEDFFYQNNTYTTNLANLGLGAAPVSCGEGNYTLSAATGASGNIATSYLLTATRAGTQAQDTKCGDLTLGSTGAKGNLNASRPASECW